MARNFLGLKELWNEDNDVGMDGITALARNLVGLELLSIEDTK